MKSSLTFQVLLHLGSYFFGFFCGVETLLILYKFIILPYPPRILVGELVLLAFLAIVEALRIYNGWRANLTENTKVMAMSVVLLIPGVLGIIYFLIWQVITFSYRKAPVESTTTVGFLFQTYILRIEMILCCVQLTIQGLEFIFAMICIISFYGGSF